MSFSRVEYAPANHAAKLLQMYEKDEGEKGEIFALCSKKVYFFAIFAKNRAVFGENLANSHKYLRMSEKKCNFVRKKWAY